ncbi:TerB family tellurite resistance protein [Hymenobacter sp. M29]|uniref:TerB family tellurite resistance protein n=1 Tax=Hymenobacter mellowenesis TaxID=3063995 RepID=A0ABT9A5P2_9BACT|nr:TerB family tellurite resistance protein [Hymenobacter sp. M29]MDO7845161.1 TerB family tellurite resistance protein [Hymenobacter sp. M29]
MDAQLLQNYSEAEKTAYLSAIASLATADRQASGAETQFLQALAQQAGLSGGATQQVLAAASDANNQTIQQNLDALKGSDLRFSLVTDLISFARADGAYANDEEAMIGKMSQYLGINPEQKQALETVVDQAATVAHDPQDPAKEGFFSRIGDKLSSVGIPKNALMAGLLGVVAPMVISRVMSGGSQNQGYGNQSSGGGLLGGLGGGGSLGGLLGGAAHSGLGGMLGGLLGGGMLGGLMGGGNSQADLPQQGSAIGSGGLGSMMSILGGLGGRPNSQPASAGGGGLGGLLGGSSLGGMLGGLFGGNR